MTDKQYAAEVARKEAAGIKLTQPKDTAALARAAAAATPAVTAPKTATSTPTATGGGTATTTGGGTTQQLIYGMTPTQYAAEVARKQAAGIPLTQPLQSGYATPPPPGSIAPAVGGSLNPLDYPSFDAYRAATAGGVTPPPGGAAPTAAGDWWSQTYTGGREGYAASQQQRYEQARAAGDADLMRRLEADAQRVGYGLPPPGGVAPPPEEEPLLPPPYIPEKAPYRQEVDQLLRQIQELTGQPVRPEDYPGYQGMQEASQQQAAKASQQAMETLNQRGILNSTVTRDQVSEIEQQAMIQLMPRLFELAYGMRQDQIGQLMNLLNTYSGLGQQEYEREVESQRWFYEQQVAQQAAAIEAEEQKVRAAWDRVKNLGYVDNSASVALGIPVGTPTYEAQKDVENRLHQLELAKQDNAAQLQRTQYTQGQIGARAGAEKTPPDKTSPTATNNAIAQIYTYKTKEAALAGLEKYSVNMAAEGVDIAAVYKAIQARWPEAKDTGRLTAEELLNLAKGGQFK